MDGFIHIDKPKGWSSFDAVAKVRSTLRPLQEVESSGGIGKQTEQRPKFRVGHAGTLDPLATGLLLVLVGRGTKQQDRFMKLDKWYEAEVTLGATSTTDDAEGVNTSVPSAPELQAPNEDEVRAVLDRFTGVIEQIPPQHSAIKIDGQRAYKLARSGEVAEIKPRTVTIHEIVDVTYAYPHLRFRVHVSSGTYIRSLARDIGAALGVGGYLSELRRTQIGEWHVDGALPPTAGSEELLRSIVPLTAE